MLLLSMSQFAPYIFFQKQKCSCGYPCLLREVVVQGTCLLPAHLPRKLACSAGAGELGSPNAPTPAKAGKLPICESLEPAPLRLQPQEPSRLWEGAAPWPWGRRIRTWWPSVLGASKESDSS